MGFGSSFGGAFMVGSKGNSLNDGHAALGLLHYTVMSEFTDKEGNRTSVRDEYLAFQGRFEAGGRLFWAGPLSKEDSEMVSVGLIICKGASLDEPMKLTDDDPVQKSGLRTWRILPWNINEGGVDLKIRFAADVYEIE